MKTGQTEPLHYASKTSSHDKKRLLMGLHRMNPVLFPAVQADNAGILPGDTTFGRQIGDTGNTGHDRHFIFFLQHGRQSLCPAVKSAVPRHTDDDLFRFCFVNH